jgi:hypothetical protein
MKILNILLVISVLFIFGCPSEDNPSKPNGNNSINDLILPLKTGNKWIYQRTVFYNDTLHKTDTNTIEVTGSRNFGSETWYFTGESYKFINRKDGLWRDATSDGGDTIITPEAALLFKYPVTQGESWLSYEGITYLANAVNVDIKVPAGTFNCIDYKKSKGNSSDYFSPGIGNIKYVRIDTSIYMGNIQYIKQVIELIEYNVSPDSK